MKKRANGPLRRKKKEIERECEATGSNTETERLARVVPHRGSKWRNRRKGKVPKEEGYEREVLYTTKAPAAMIMNAAIAGQAWLPKACAAPLTVANAVVPATWLICVVKSVPHVVCMLLYSALCPWRMSEFDRPMAYGTEVSNLMYDAKMFLLQDVHSTSLSASGWRKRKAMFDDDRLSVSIVDAVSDASSPVVFVVAVVVVAEDVS